MEQTIYARRDRRVRLMKLALNPDEFKQNTHTRAIGDDVDDDVEDDWTVETLLSLPQSREN